MIAGSFLLIAGAVTLLVWGLWQSSGMLLGASTALSLLAAVVLVVGARRAAATSPEPSGGGSRRHDTEPIHPGRGHDPRYDPAHDPRYDPGHDPAHDPRYEPAHDHGPGSGYDGSGYDGSGYESGHGSGQSPHGPEQRYQPDYQPDWSGHGQEPGHDPGRAARGRGPAHGPVHEPQGAARHEGHQPAWSGEPAHAAWGGATAPGQASRAAAAEPVTTSIPVQQHAPEHESTEPYDEDVDPPDEPAPQQVSATDAARVGRMSTEVLVVDGRPRYHLPGCVHLLGRECEPLPVGEAIELGFTPCSLCEPDSALLADARRV